MSDAATPRVAVVGCGAWGRNHVRTFNALGALVAVADDDPGTARAAAGGLVEVRSFTSIIRDSAIDAVVIATPDALHADMALRALVAGKHVLVEKPMTMSTDEADELLQAAAAQGRVLMTGHLLRFHAAFRGLLAALPSIGTLRLITARRMHLARGAPRHALWDLCPHDLSMILAVAGEMPNRISAITQYEATPGRPQSGCLSLGFESGLSAEIGFSAIHPVKLHQFTVGGDDGHIVFDDTRPWPEKLVRFTPGLARHGQPTTGEPLALAPGEPLAEEARAFLDAIGGRPLPAASGEEGARVVRILAAAERARLSGTGESL